MSKIYLPSEYVDSPCKIVNNGYIRAYDNSSLTNYTDIYINQDYMIKKGRSNTGYTGTCDIYNTYTDNFYYRNDFSQILFIFLIFTIFIVYIPTKIVSKLFIRGSLWKK